ncbi:MAG TPA: hypothetical protein VFU80_04315 [Sphingomicrobium sp.]|nr:hypothetical protein [Sphingomicrobium sp.]
MSSILTGSTIRYRSHAGGMARKRITHSQSGGLASMEIPPR